MGSGEKDGMTRRVVLGMLGGAGVAVAVPGWVAAQTAAAAQFALSIHGASVRAQVPDTYTGLSYESAQLTHAGFFSAANTALVAMVRTLGANGVLRIGGNTSAYTTWATTAAAEKDSGGYGPDRGAQATKQTPGMYKLTPAAIDNLRGFLDETGWQLIYGLNLRNGTPEAAADEAAYVVKKCGPKLVALQFGNEPDLFRHDDAADGGKGSLWSYDEFLPKWKAMYAAVHARVPEAKIAGPDSAFKKDWAGRFAADTKGEISLLTTHYYAEGPPTDPRMTIDLLLHPAERIAQEVYPAIDAAKAAGLPYRMSEGNSCYNGGKPGVSDTLASALWAGDFMLDLAARGATGVNLHGGGMGVYTPIATSGDGTVSARPDFYGMWLAGQFAGAGIVDSRLQATGALTVEQANLTGYVAQRNGGTLVAVFNKGASPAEITVTGAGAAGELFPLAGPSLGSTSGVVFGRGSREIGTVWTLESAEAWRGGKLRVPAGSAVLLRSH